VGKKARTTFRRLQKNVNRSNTDSCPSLQGALSVRRKVGNQNIPDLEGTEAPAALSKRKSEELWFAERFYSHRGRAGPRSSAERSRKAERMETPRCFRQDLTWVFKTAWQAQVLGELRNVAFIPGDRSGRRR